MKRVFWGGLWLGAASLAGCYGNMEPGSTTSIGSSLPIDTVRYAPTKTAPIVYRSRAQPVSWPLPPKAATDADVAARIRTPDVAAYVPPAQPRPAATTLPATRRVRETTDQELQALSPVGRIPASPVPRIDGPIAPATSASVPALPSRASE